MRRTVTILTMAPVRTAIAIAGLVGVVTSAPAATLHYIVDATDPDSGVLHISYTLEDYPYPTAEMTLGRPPADATTYFEFFDGIEYATREDVTLTPVRTTVGRASLDGIDGVIQGRYDIRVAELNRVVGSGVRMPVFTSEGLVLPLRAVLVRPDEIETRGLVIDPITVEFKLPAGWPLLTPWASYDMAITFRDDARDQLLIGTAVAGNFQYRDYLNQHPPGLQLFHGATSSGQKQFDEVLTALTREHVNGFGTHGTSPITFIVEVTGSDVRAEAKGSGPFVRIQCPASYLELTPEELRVGTDGYRFYKEVSHELYHAWLGVRGELKPLTPSVFWLTEGSADYLGAVALAASGVAPRESVLDYVADAGTRLRAMENRADPIDLDEPRWETDAAYRDLLLTKGPLACFVLDIDMRTARKEGHSLSTSLMRLYYETFLRSAGLDMEFGPAEFGKRINDALGLRGRLVIANYIRDDVLSVLPQRAAKIGLEWTESESGFELRPAGDPDAVYEALLRPPPRPDRTPEESGTEG